MAIARMGTESISELFLFFNTKIAIIRAIAIAMVQLIASANTSSDNVTFS